jgi:IS5 family transposase
LTGGQRHDITQDHKLAEGLQNSMVIADKGYDSNALIQTLAEQKSIAVIPPKKNRKIQRE